MRQVTHHVLTLPAEHPTGLPWPLRLGDHALDPSAATHFVSYWLAHSWVTNGCLAVGVEGQWRTLSAGQGFFCRVGEAWQLRNAGDRPVLFRSVDWVGQLPGSATHQRLFTVANGDAVRDAFERLRTHLSPEQSAHDLRVQADAFALLAALHQTNGGERSPLRAPNALLATASQQARLHLAAGIGLAELARKCGVSLSTLRRHFLEETGKPAGQMLTDLKMERARILLKTTDFTHDFIARECGFRTEPAFSRSFSRAHAQPPSQWRRAAKLNQRQAKAS